MASRHELQLEQKMSLINDKENGVNLHLFIPQLRSKLTDVFLASNV